MNTTDKARSWFCTWNNPENTFPDLSETEIAEKVADIWHECSPTRTCAVAYCISADGLKHLHMVLEDSSQVRFSALKKLFPPAHFDATKGTKEQAEDYIQKRGRFSEKGEQVVHIARRGEIKANQGQRKDIEVIEELIESGLRPNQIMDKNIRYYRYKDMIRWGYSRKRFNDLPAVRVIKAIYHVGESGSGKTYTYVNLVNQYGSDDVYMLSDYAIGGFDQYSGEKVLFMDEFRGNIPFNVLMQILQGYKQQIHARYSNIYALWDEIHIASVIPPEKLYENMVSENRDLDSQEQLFRRIDIIIYHWKDQSGYHEFALPMSEYQGYEALRLCAIGDDFHYLDSKEKVPFD